MHASKPEISFARFNSHTLSQASHSVHGGQKMKYVASASATSTTNAIIKSSITPRLMPRAVAKRPQTQITASPMLISAPSVSAARVGSCKGYSYRQSVNPRPKNVSSAITESVIAPLGGEIRFLIGNFLSGSSGTPHSRAESATNPDSPRSSRSRNMVRIAAEFRLN